MATIKRGDTGQRIGSTLKLNGAAYNLTGKTVTFVAQNRDTLAVTRAAATVLSTVNGTVQYAPSEDFVSEPAVYNCEWEVDIGGGEILTFPHGSYARLEIAPDLREDDED